MFTPYSIAIVDDNSLVRTLVSAELRKHKCNISFQAENGEECISKIKQSNYLPDMIILDIEMPKMDGFTTAHIVRRNWPSIKIIAMSTLEDETSINRILEAGADCFLSKASNIKTDLVGLIQYMLTLNSYGDSNKNLKPLVHHGFNKLSFPMFKQHCI
ncbi:MULTISPECIES: response regulator [unclassified Arcicella]|uniref:response regulator n=1 Tax=unclassified Arcicella TaxID=2644986 RepID=UPI00285A7B85|nr:MULTISPECIES: response regulator [unclassified Arcicella]MDR6561252.1 CheY-like chemotaxis protein [Arcicella sp. BE51]MDR6811136.1 CheY-like chemotaxis protein [Arcicella sp. BE140]MDR6822486.1 CheY-like chemotaxis protein [Arcicella sp. BE139]